MRRVKGFGLLGLDLASCASIAAVVRLDSVVVPRVNHVRALERNLEDEDATCDVDVDEIAALFCCSPLKLIERTQREIGWARANHSEAIGDRHRSKDGDF